jgi:hypothetical protein
MGCACNPNTPEPMVNLQQDYEQNQTNQQQDEGPVVAAKTGNFAMMVSLVYKQIRKAITTSTWDLKFRPPRLRRKTASKTSSITL